MKPYTVEFLRLRKWSQSKIAVNEYEFQAGAERAASCRSVNSGLIYRVRKDDVTLSHWKNGEQITIARNE